MQLPLPLPVQPARPPSRAARAAARFPLEAVNALAALENHNKHLYRPAHYVHKWWARRPGSVFRALLLSLLLPEDEDVWEAYYAGADLAGAAVLDPFMGGGTTIAEALRLGCRAVGCDLNPVAYWTAKMAVTRADPTELEAAFRRVEAAAAPAIRARYATTCGECGGPAEAVRVLWIHQPPCPACGAAVPLRDGPVLARHAGTADLLCPRCEWVWRAEPLPETATCPRCAERFPTSARRGAPGCGACGTSGVQVFRSSGVQVFEEVDAVDPVDPVDGRVRSPEHLNTRTPEHHPSPPARPLAVLARCPEHGERWQAVGQADRAAAAAAEAECRPDRSGPELLCPAEEIPTGQKTGDLLRHGCRHWRDLFLPRQLLCLDTLLRAILALEPGPPRDLLLTLFSGCLEFNNRYCTYKGGHPRRPGAVRHVFSHHAFVFPRQPLESQLWGIPEAPGSGTFAALYRSRLLRGQAWAAAPAERRLIPTQSGPRVVRVPGEELRGRFAPSIAALLAGEGNVFLACRDSATLELPDGALDAIVTDPPYYDNVMYGELADFFHVWLRLGLREREPAFAPPLGPKEGEAVANRARGELAAFGAGLRRVFERCRAALKADGVLAFTFHHRRPEAWAALLEALCGAGFRVEAALPVGAESRQSVHVRDAGSGSRDLILFCAKREAPEPGEWAAIRQRAEAEAAQLLARLGGPDGWRRADLEALHAGCLLAALSPHWPEVAGEGAPETALEAFRALTRRSSHPSPPWEGAGGGVGKPEEDSSASGS